MNNLRAICIKCSSIINVHIMLLLPLHVDNTIFILNELIQSTHVDTLFLQMFIFFKLYMLTLKNYVFCKFG